MRKVITKQLAAACVAMLTLSGAASAATLLVNDGILVGATDIIVGTGIYDVTLVDTNCINAFSGCDAASDFDFTSEVAASAAAQALLDQVFIDDPLGNFDSQVEFISGCPSPGGFNTACLGSIPYAISADQVLFAAAENFSTGAGVDFVGLRQTFITADFGGLNSFVWADFTQTGVIPIPAAVWLFGSALGLLGWIKRRG